MSQLFRGLFVAWLATSNVAASAASLDEAREFVRQGDFAQALATLDSFLAESPDNPQGRFLKGVSLAETKRVDQAIEVFKALTSDYPQLPEPHNNLAVLYAARGDYDEARDALLVAIETHPSYATAHENLGDIYAKMAGLAYDHALVLESDNRGVAAKLRLLRELLSLRDPTTTETAAVMPASTAAVPTPPALDPELARVAARVQSWASAWSRQDVDGYLSHYGPGFQPPGGAARDTWEQQRRARLNRPKFIDVQVSEIAVEIRGADRARALFVQQYRSDTYEDRVRKRLDFMLVDGTWMVSQEQNVR